ncbi:hypothetical protein [Acidovorax delafieldii]|uniref:hypothetical protein n=1 Tax=Acidovorax delafieldii TaxID=47920 RepID=UPI003ECF53D3
MTTHINEQAQQLDWAEKAAIEHLKARLATGDALHAQASQLLTLLLAGMTGALAIGSKVFESYPGPVQWGAAVVSAWLASICVVLTLKAIATRTTQTQYNEPRNLYRAELAEKYTLQQLREFELENVQQRIDLTKARNANVAWWLDRCRYAAAATPAVFAVAAAISA